MGIRIVCFLWLSSALLAFGGCRTNQSSSEEEIEKVAHENQELVAAQQKRIDGQQRLIESLQRNLASQQRQIENQQGQVEELQRNLADHHGKIDRQQKQIGELQQQTTELQKRPTTNDTQLSIADRKNLPTTTEFRQKAVGMTRDDLMKWLGRPSFTADLGSDRLFYYNDAARDPDSERAVRACVTIKNGTVTEVGYGF